MKKFIFLLGAMLVFSISSAQTQRTTTTTDPKSGQKTTIVKAADGTTVQQTTTTTTVDTDATPDQTRQNTSDILTPVGAKVNATDGQTAPRSANATDPTDTNAAIKTTTTTTTTKTTTPRP